jgi:hypothetical protein
MCARAGVRNGTRASGSCGYTRDANVSTNGMARRCGREWHDTAYNGDKERLGQRGSALLTVNSCIKVRL